MQLDTERYRHHLAEYDMSEEEKVRLMEQLWDVLHSFVIREQGHSPEQLLQRITAFESCNPESDGLDFNHSISTTYNDAATGEAARKSSL